MAQISGSATLAVSGPTPTTVTSVDVTLAAGAIGPGGAVTALARLNGGNLTSLPSGATAAWTSSDATVATVVQDPTNPLAATVSAVSGGAPTGVTDNITVTCTVTE